MIEVCEIWFSKDGEEEKIFSRCQHKLKTGKTVIELIIEDLEFFKNVGVLDTNGEPIMVKGDDGEEYAAHKEVSVTNDLTGSIELTFDVDDLHINASMKTTNSKLDVVGYNAHTARTNFKG